MAANAEVARRRFIGQVLSGLVARGCAPAGFLAGPAAAQTVPSVKAVVTDLRSDSERMISYRHQQHLVQTPDGALHLLFNCGGLTPNPGLTLHSSFDGGLTWAFMLSFADTDPKSTGDLLLQGDDLSIVYHNGAKAVMFAQLHYDAVPRTWTMLTLQQAWASTQWDAQNPALAVDELGTIWVGFSARTARGPGNIRVINRVGGGTLWTDPNLVFGPTDQKAPERSARPVAIPGGMGMVWTAHEVTYWSQRPNGLPDNSAWQTVTIFTGVPGKVDDPYASHFNVVADAARIHVITIENFDVLYLRLDLTTGQWSAPIVLDDSRKVTYAQISSANGKLAVAFSVQRGKGRMIVSGNSGVTWAPACELQLITTYPGIEYNTARVEMPSRFTGTTLPILQQYADDESEKAMLFRVPAP